MANTPDTSVMAADTVGAQASPATNTHQLDFYQAMVDFRVMFPNMDEEIIEAVLRANNGAVDATIDQLLTMNVDTSPSSGSAGLPVHVEAAYATAQDVKTERDIILAERSDPVATSNFNPTSKNTDVDFLEPIYSVPKPTNSKTLEKIPAKSPKTQDIMFPTEKVVLQDHVCKVDNPGSVKKPIMLQPLVNNDLCTPAAATFDPFDDEFFRTPSTPKPHQPPNTDSSHMVQNSSESPPKTALFQKWRPPLLGDLPDDFLRIIITPDQQQQMSCASSSSGASLSSTGKRKKCKKSHAEHNSQQMSPPVPSGLNSEILAAKIAENSRLRSEVGSNSDKAQMLDDEMFALYLQNEEFLNDLRHDEDFMRTLERERMSATAFEPADVEYNNRSSHTESGAGDTLHDENAELRRQLKHMGGSSKKKLATLARRFFSRTKKKKSSKQILRESSDGGPRHEILEDEDSIGAMSSLRENSESNLIQQASNSRD